MGRGRNGSPCEWGARPPARLRKLLGTEAQFPDDEAGYQTPAGLVLRQAGRVPAESDRLKRDGYRFEVLDMDRQRVDRVLVSALKGDRYG